jgi:hypothetical protein
MKKNLLLLSITLYTFIACDDIQEKAFSKTKGTGAVEKFTRDAKGFKGVDIQASADVELKQTVGDFGVVVETHKNIADIFETVVENDILCLRFKPNQGNVSYDKLIVYVDAPTFEKLIVSGSGNFKGNTLKSQSLTTEVSGSGNISLDAVETQDFKANIGGSGNITINGMAEKATYDVSGSGDIEAKMLKAKEVKADVSGSANVNCNAEVSIEAEVSGSGNVYYSGNPSVKSKVSGSGNIEKQ